MSPSPIAKPLRSSVVVAVAAFIALGLAESGIGPAWPSISLEFARPLSDLGTLLAAGLGGYAALSALSGRISRHVGLGATLVAAALVSLSGVALYVVAAGWQYVVLAAVTLGSGGGLLDSALNAHAAHRFTPGAMNLLHAGFGVGATMGPLLVAAALGFGNSWQAAYVVIAVAQIALVIVLVRQRTAWKPVAAPAPRTSRLQFDRVAAASLAMFFLYTGVEVAAGQWSFTVVTESRGVATGQAGAWVAAYWAGLTVGRLVLSAIATRLGSRRILTLSMAGTLVGTAVFWWDPAGLGVWGLPIAGLSLAGIFPTLVSLTPQRLGVERTTSIVGYQLAAASLGAAAVPWAIGRLIAATSLEAVAPTLTLAATAMTALNTLLDRIQPSGPK